MNMQPSFLKTSVLSLLLLNATVSFGMEIAPQEVNTKNLSVKKQDKGIVRLHRLYKGKDYNKAKQTLLKKHVPVVLLDTSPLTTENLIEMVLISPYHPDFYSMSQRKPSKKLLLIENDRMHEALNICKEKRKQQAEALGLSVPLDWSVDIHRQSDPLILGSLFGNTNDVIKELEKNSGGNLEHSSARIFCATAATLFYAYKNKENLALLLSEQNQIQQYSRYSLPGREITSYELLLYSSKNKDDFAFIAKSDPYDMNNVPWQVSDESPFKTHLDLMFEDKNFNNEHVKVMRDINAVTARELVDKDLENSSGEL